MPHKGKNIYKRKDGRWEGRYIKYYDSNHKAQYGYIYAKSYSEVKQKLFEAKSLLQQDKQLTSNTKTVENISMMWLDAIKTKVRPSTMSRYTNIVINHIIPSIGKNDISLMSTQLVKEFAEEKLAFGKVNGEGGLSERTVGNILSALKMIILYAESIGISYCCNFDKINIKVSKKDIIVLSRNEQQIFTSYLINDIDNCKLGILICLYTGLRVGEICALKFEDILMSDGILSVTKAMQRVQNFTDSSDSKTDVMVTLPRSKNSVRDIPLPQFIIDLITKRNFYYPKAYVLSGESYTYVEPRTLQNRLKTYISECGLKNINFHDLRRTFAIRCVENGFDIKSLSEILGVSNINDVLNSYAHSSMDLKRKNMEMLEETLNLGSLK